ncbi:MAG TPA: efflux RND transporter periplasmic adaptor subunit [Vicinamibacteria bacterium]|nr:efflux RND transporter periplasmic adaptor subunit [Vicinamibacteria bacterium]
MWRFFASLPLLAAGQVLASDDGPLSRVSYTEVRSQAVARAIDLPGTVEAPKSSRVASEVEGVVDELFVREGQHVKKDAPLAKLRSADLELELVRARADKREAEARLALAERQLERAQELHDQEVLSREQLDDARFEHEAWRGRADRLEAEIQRTELDIERSTIRAPFSGVVTREATEVGEWIAKGATVVELISPYVLEIRIDVPERHYAQIRSGATAVIRFETLPELELDGQVVSLVPKANDSARTFPMRIRVENADGDIGVGMLAQVQLEAGEHRPERLVPKDAVISRGGDRFVFVLGEDQTVSQVPVSTGLGVGQWVVVEGQLPEDAKVITRGNERIRPGQKVVAEPLRYPVP